MKRFTLAVVFSLFCVATSATQIYNVNQCQEQGGWDTLANLTSYKDPSGLPCNTAWTADVGLVYSNGTSWVVPGGSAVTGVSLSAPAVFTASSSGGPGAVSLSLAYATGQAATEVLGTDGSGNVGLFALTSSYVPPIQLNTTANGGIANTLGSTHGGTGLTSVTAHGVMLGEGTGAVGVTAALGADTLLQGQGSSVDPAAVSVPNCVTGLSYSTSTHTFGCPSSTVLTGTATAGGTLLAAGGCQSVTTTVSGATTSMTAAVSPAADPGNSVQWQAFVSSSNTVTVRVCAILAVTPASVTYNIRVQ